MPKEHAENARRLRPQWRIALLDAVYEETGASVTEFVDARALGAALGIPDAEVGKALGYLEEKGWLRVDDHRSGVVRLTAAGADAVEASA